MAYKIKCKSLNKQKNKFSKKMTRKTSKKSKKNYRGSGPSLSKHSKCNHDLTHSGVSTMKITDVSGHQGEWLMHLKCKECKHEDTISCFNKHKPTTLQDCQEH